MNISDSELTSIMESKEGGCDYGDAMDRRKGGCRSQGTLSLDLDKSSCDRRKSVSGPNERQMMVYFEFPDGSFCEESFQMGQTVEVLKAYLHSEFGVAMTEVELEYNGRSMLDPLSLNDFVASPEMGMEVYVSMDSDNWLRESKGK